MERSFFNLPVTRIFLLAALLLLLPTRRKLETYRKEGVRLPTRPKNMMTRLATLKKALQQDQFDAVSNAYAGLIEYRDKNYVAGRIPLPRRPAG